MALSLVRPVEVEQTARVKGGLLDVAHPAPEGWERGIAVAFYGCAEPIVADKCVNFDAVANRPEVQEFSMIPIEQGSTCSTLSRLDHSDIARARLETTTEWALGRQMQTDIVGTGNPSLDDATLLGVVAEADFVTAVGCLEQAAADTGFGSEWFLHAPPRAASYLAYMGLIDLNRLSPSGAKWIISPGYLPEDDTTVRIWATGPVWVGADAPRVTEAVGFQTNDDTAYALRVGLVAFDPCMNLAIDVTVPACPTPTSP
jgi:hypothetical protein